MQASDKVQRFLRVFEIPDFIIPWVDRFFEEIEINLVMRLANRALTREDINRAFLSRSRLDYPDTNFDLTTRAYRKGIINLREDNRFDPADFHARFDKWAMFEGWKDIPDKIRDQLKAWEFAHYEKKHLDHIADLKKGQLRDESLVYPEYLLLHEAEALLELAKHIYLLPCNCRSMENKCSNRYILVSDSKTIGGLAGRYRKLVLKRSLIRQIIRGLCKAERWELKTMGVSRAQYAIAVLIAAILTNLLNISTLKTYGHYRAMSPDTSKTAVLPAAAVSSDVPLKHLRRKRGELQRKNQFNSMKIYVAAVAFVVPVVLKKLLR